MSPRFLAPSSNRFFKLLRVLSSGDRPTIHDFHSLTVLLSCHLATCSSAERAADESADDEWMSAATCSAFSASMLACSGWGWRRETRPPSTVPSKCQWLLSSPSRQLGSVAALIDTLQHYRTERRRRQHYWQPVDCGNVSSWRLKSWSRKHKAECLLFGTDNEWNIRQVSSAVLLII